MDLLVPPKREIVVYAPLSKEQEELYRMSVDKSIASWVVARKVRPVPFTQELPSTEVDLSL